MPELPEVETIRRELEREVVGRKIKTVDVLGTRSVRRQTKKQFITALEGAKLTGVTRKGKFLVIGLDTGEQLVVHLRMSGQLLRSTAKTEMDKHTHVVLTFTQSGQLRFLDPRTFGEMFVVHPDQMDEVAPEIGALGLDPVDQPVSWTVFGRLLHAHHLKLKQFLMDQTIVAGIGNIYSDEILFAAGLRYDRFSDEMSTMEIRRLYRAVVETLHDAIKYSGSSLADQQYVDIFGKTGSYQDYHQVYARDKQACRRCRGVIAKAKFAQRSTYFCPDCQM